MIQLKIWGGAGEHGRSCYLLQCGDIRILLDCGVKRAGSGEYPLLDPAEIPRINVVFLSHAHEDHSIALPLLYKYGYRGKVWTSRITAELLPAYYATWSRYIKRQNGQLPYDEADIGSIDIAYLDEAVAALSWLELGSDLRVCWGRSGHMLGSVWLLLELSGKRFFYSGDYTEESLLLRTDSPDSFPGGFGILDGAIVDAAYGTDAESQLVKREQILSVAQQILTGGGQLLLPVPYSGRGQELLLMLQQRFPEVPLRVEEELLPGLEKLLLKPDWLKPEACEMISNMLDTFEVIRGKERRIEVVQPDVQPGIILTGDGMMQSSKAQWYYEQLRHNPRNGIILTGHASKHTLADRLLRMTPQEQGCRIEHIIYKIHQGLPDVRRMLQSLTCSAVILAHASHSSTEALRQQLEMEEYDGILSLRPGDTLSL